MNEKNSEMKLRRRVTNSLGHQLHDSHSPTSFSFNIQHSTSEKSKMRRKLPDGYQKGKKCERGGGGDEK